MKFHSPTQRKEHRRCPKRYQYRYMFDPSDEQEQEEHRSRRQLYGVRELGGLVVHQTVARMVRALADGEVHGNYIAAGERCREEFLELVAQSCAVEPGIFIGGPQLAETYNGTLDAEAADEIRYWRDSIPTMVENAGRAIITLGVKSSTSEYTVTAEKPLIWTVGTNRFRFVVDVLTQSKYQSVIIDFKCHSIDQQDVIQVRNYLQFLHQREGIPVSRLFGFAVDLRREEIVPVKYDPFGLARHRSSSHAPATLVPKPEVFLAKPHPELCRRCPYATLCPESALITFPELLA